MVTTCLKILRITNSPCAEEWEWAKEQRDEMTICFKKTNLEDAMHALLIITTDHENLILAMRPTE